MSYFSSLKLVIKLSLFINSLTELFSPFRWSGNYVLAGGLQQSSYTRSPCCQLEIKAVSTNIKNTLFS